MKINSFSELLPTDIESALIVTQYNRRYFTDFDSTDGFLLVTRKGSVFYTDSRYIEAAEKKIKCCEVCEGKQVFAQIKDFLNQRGIKNIAVEDSITVAQYNAMCKNPKLSEFDILCGGEVDEAITRLREVKSEEEKEKIIAAQRIAEQGFLHILNFIKEGRTEKEIQLELDFFMLKNGAEALSFDTIAVSGVNSSMPHGVPSDKRIEKGDFITMDFGAVVEGYHSDMTRTVAVGFVTDEQRQIYDTVLAAQTAALGTIRAGVACVDGDKAARSVIENADFGSFFGHGTGHGVGIEIHESPNLSPKSKATLRKGNIVTVEPGIYIPGKFGVRIEDMAYITESGCENLTKAEKSLIIL